MSTNHSGIDHVSVPVAVLIGAVIIAASVLFAGARISGSATAQATAGAAAAAAQRVAAQPKARVGDVAQVKTAGNPIIGSASAPIVMAYWFDYQCPVCQTFEENVMTQIKHDYIDTGKIRVVLKDLQFLGPDSQTLGLTARAVWQLAPDKFAAWHKAAFDNQGHENSGWATPDKIKSITSGVLGASLTDQVIALAASNATTFRAKMDADKSEGSGFGISATPSFIIGNQVLVGLSPYATIKAAIDAALLKK